MGAAIFGFIGAIFGSVTTAWLTIYRERITTRREIDLRDRQYERDEKTALAVFQRDSILALQTSVTNLISAAYSELDRLLARYHESGSWQARTWDTPTAKEWSSTLFNLENARARVFDDGLRAIAAELREQAGKSIWADSREAAEVHSRPLEALNGQFNDAVRQALPPLY